MCKSLFLVPALLLFGAAQAADITGRVVRVIDGDTVSILEEDSFGKREVRVRLAAIDAPERGQDFGSAAKQTLSTFCFGRQASVVVEPGKSYDRVVGHLTCGGVQANLQMVRAGMAFVDMRYNPLPEYVYAERQAREGRFGVWSQPNPMTPAEWRKRVKAQREGGQ